MGQSWQKYKGRVVLRGLWKMIQYHMQYLLNRDHQHHKRRLQKYWISYQDCQDAQDKQRTQYLLIPRSKWKMLQNCCKFQSQNVQIFGFVYHDTNGQNHGPAWKTQSFLLSEICTVILWQDYLWERQFEKVLLEHGWEKAPDWECLFVHREKDCSCLCMWTISNSVERNRTFIGLGKSSWICWFGRTNIMTWPRLLGLHSKRMKNQQRYCWQFSTISAGAAGKLPSSVRLNANISTWSYDMGGHAKKYVERYCELANETTQQPYKVSTPCLDDRQFKEEEWGSVGELSKVCSQIVLKCLYLARIGRPDILWSANKLARAATKCTRACDERLACLISYIHLRSELEQYCHV